MHCSIDVDSPLCPAATVPKPSGTSASPKLRNRTHAKTLPLSAPTSTFAVHPISLQISSSSQRADERRGTRATLLQQLLAVYAQWWDKSVWTAHAFSILLRCDSAPSLQEQFILAQSPTFTHTLQRLFSIQLRTGCFKKSNKNFLSC